MTHTSHRHILFIILALIGLSLAGSTNVRAQQLYAYRNMAKNGYNFWLYSPEAPPKTLVPLKPSDSELEDRMNLEDCFHAKPADWVNWKEKEERKKQEKLKPLIVFLHGASLCGHDLKRVLRYGTLDAMDRGLDIDAYVLAPQNPGEAWDPDKLIRLTEWATRTHPGIDSTRIYVLGMSLGGFGALDFPAAYPDRIAASISICGGSNSRTIGNLNRLPLWIFHGTADELVPISRSDRVVAALRRDSIPKRLLYTRLKGFNHSQPCRLFYMKETYEWLFSHSLLDKDRPVNREIYIGVGNISPVFSKIGRKGHLKHSGNKEVYGHGHAEAMEFALLQDSLLWADSVVTADNEAPGIVRIGRQKGR